MKPLFNQIKVNRPKRNLFDMSFEKKLSCNMGELIPVHVQEVVPGDKFKISVEQLTRLAPMLAPMMHRVNMYFHAFYVPMRLVYDNWSTYINGGVDGQQSATFPVLTLTNTNKAEWGLGTLADYLGIPTPPAGVITQPLTVNGLPFRAYQLIYNEYYRDQTLSTPVDAGGRGDTFSQAQQTAACTLRMRAWEKDYFTSALPWTQRGATVNLPTTLNYKPAALIRTQAGNWASAESVKTTAGVGNNTVLVGATSGSQSGIIDNLNSVDISVINLRRSLKLQQWLERNAQAGARLIETVAMHFGIISDDLRLMRPKYIGGTKAPITVSEVVSMVKETSNPQGTMTGHGISAGGDLLCNEFVKEHGYIMIIMSCLPRTGYNGQGLPRMFSKVDRYDFFWPEFENIGEQAILNKELYYDITNATNDGTFGYTPRYAEYKFNHSTVHGDFKTTLNYWGMQRIFAAAPSLNEAFVMSDPTNRVFAVQDTSDHLWIHLYFKVKALRPMQVFATPSL